MSAEAKSGVEAEPNDELRVWTRELFFDLVFVFTITQLTAVLVHHPNGEALGQVVLMLAAIWWMYGAFAWLTNAVPPDRTGGCPPPPPAPPPRPRGPGRPPPCRYLAACSPSSRSR